ncbi:MAG TPA: hypothetical protein VFR36_05510 [Sphingomicrobium sp.]|nr:hypothetical protein [Sphingomicrobium sp.]
MTRPLASGKQSVNLASSGVKVSRIRRDPPPKVKEKQVDVDEVDRRDVVIGVIAFALSIFVITLAVGSYNGWSPSQYTINIKDL